MILYHRTSFTRGIKILNDGKILTKAERVYDETYILQTSKGFIYLSDDLAIAMYYANKTSFIDNDEYMYVFKCEINDNLLLPDLDEIKYTKEMFGHKITDEIKNNAFEVLKLTNSTRVNFDIDLKENNVSYTIIPSTGYFINDSAEIYKQRIDIRQVIDLRGNNTKIAIEFKNKIISNFKWEKF